MEQPMTALQGITLQECDLLQPGFLSTRNRSFGWDLVIFRLETAFGSTCDICCQWIWDFMGYKQKNVLLFYFVIIDLDVINKKSYNNNHTTFAITIFLLNRLRCLIYTRTWVS